MTMRIINFLLPRYVGKGLTLVLFLSVGVSAISPATVFGQASSRVQNGCDHQGYYGPTRPGMPYKKDDYQWAYTQEFADRYCLPRANIDKELKGASAIAWRARPFSESYCRIIKENLGYLERCVAGMRIYIDLYLPSGFIPRANVKVDYFERESSAASTQLLQRREVDTRYDELRLGKRSRAPNTFPPYGVPDIPGPSDLRTKFSFVSTIDANLYTKTLLFLDEMHYQHDWDMKTDVLTLAYQPSPFGDDLKLPAESGGKSGSAIYLVTFRANDGKDDPKTGSRLMKHPEDFRQSIRLPKKLAEWIFSFDCSVVKKARHALNDPRPHENCTLGLDPRLEAVVETRKLSEEEHSNLFKR